MAEIQTTSWDSTAANNNSTPPDGWPEGQSPASVNDCARELMAAVKRWFTRVMGLTDAGALISSAGTSTAITVTYDVAPASLYTGLECAFKVTTTCGVAPTLDVNSLGAKNIQKFRGGYVNIQPGDITAGQHVKVKYDGTLDKWILIGDAPHGDDLISVQTASASATIDFVLTSYIGAYRAFKVVFVNVLPATDNVSFIARTSTDGGSTFDSGAGTYSWARYLTAEDALSSATGSTGDTSILMANAVDNASTSGLSGSATLYDPSNTAAHKLLESNIAFVSNGDLMCRTMGGGRRKATADVDAIRFLFSSGNIASGTFALYGIK